MLAESIAVPGGSLQDRVTAEILENKHEWAQIDEQERFKYIVLPADSSRFRNPGQGVAYFCLDDDYAKIEFMPIVFVSGLRIDRRGIGIIKNAKRTTSSRKASYFFLPLNLYDMLGSSEQIDFETDRKACAVFIRRSRSGIPKRLGISEKMEIENNFCIALLVNGSPETESFTIKDFSIRGDYKDDDTTPIPAFLRSDAYGNAQVINLRGLFNCYRQSFFEKCPHLRGFYPDFSKKA